MCESRFEVDVWGPKSTVDWVEVVVLRCKHSSWSVEGVEVVFFPCTHSSISVEGEEVVVLPCTHSSGTVQGGRRKWFYCVQTAVVPYRGGRSNGFTVYTQQW